VKQQFYLSTGKCASARCRASLQQSQSISGYIFWFWIVTGFS